MWPSSRPHAVRHPHRRRYWIGTTKSSVREPMSQSPMAQSRAGVSSSPKASQADPAVGPKDNACMRSAPTTSARVNTQPPRLRTKRNRNKLLPSRTNSFHGPAISIRFVATPFRKRKLPRLLSQVRTTQSPMDTKAKKPTRGTNQNSFWESGSSESRISASRFPRMVCGLSQFRGKSPLSLSPWNGVIPKSPNW